MVLIKEKSYARSLGVWLIMTQMEGILISDSILRGVTVAGYHTEAFGGLTAADFHEGLIPWELFNSCVIALGGNDLVKEG